VGSFVPALNIFATFLSDASYAFLVGTCLARYWLRAEAVPASLLRGLGAVLLGVLIVCHLVRPWFIASSMSGSTRFRETLALVPAVLSTRQGGLWYTNSIALAILLGIHFIGGSRAVWAGAVALCALAVTKAASSHASEQGDFSTPEVAQFLHLAATSVWAGAVVVSGFWVVPRFAVNRTLSALWRYARHLSQTVTWALIILLLSGVYVAWVDMHGTLHPLWSSFWGKLLLTKAALASLAIVLGGWNRFRVLGGPEDTPRAATMAKLLRSEAFVMIGILSLSSMLGNTNPFP